MSANPIGDVDATSLRLAVFSDTYPPQVNGVSRTLERLIGAVSARGGTARVFTVDDPHATPLPHVQRYPSRPFWAYDQLRLAWPSQKHVRSALTAFAPTLVHAATEFGVGIAGRRAALALGVPLVSSYHTSFSAYAKFYHLGVLARPGWRFMRWFHNAGLRTYCPTQAIVNEVATHGFTHTAVWSRGVDTARFAPSFRSTTFRQEIGATTDTLVLTYVGRLAQEKGLDVAMQALRIVDRERPGRMRFVAVGDGPYQAAVRQLAPTRSYLPGALHGDALSTAYASGDVFLFPSTTDTLGNVLLEAMASGMPIVGADVGPTREQVSTDRGWLVTPGSAAAFADALIALIDNRTPIHVAREQALRFAATKSWSGVWNALIGDYLTLHRPC